MTGEPSWPSGHLTAGRYVCVRTPGRLAAVIRWACKSDVNHTVVAGPGGEIVEATPRGVRRGHLNEYAGMVAYANLFEPMTAAQGQQIWAAACGMVGDLYDFPDLAAIGLGDLGWHWKWLIRVCGGGPWRICSQVAVLAAAVATPPLNWLCGDGNACQVTPALLAARPGVVPITIT